ncbi:4-hydroxy-tetrahydrodipicolinate synthase [uncultured Clostridium sp.]|uniref:4-hydroxy-tetrahydrodipicolinate synthase n=1 Tax=uncultured Clostridium sp. TaxID=59620 RepID=UPI0025D840CA|nr:4-hydroxy-tetrahydrodipicolinate synthase [uncultured Clostridium sp.]
MKFSGVWLPIITPFKDGKVDFNSYKNMIENYIDTGITGFIPLGTTGETPTLSDDEYFSIIEKTIEYVKGRVKVVVGVGGNNTKALIEKAKKVEALGVDGILSVCPYYNRPDQRGIYEHFKALAEAIDTDIILYNIPYRTGRNIEIPTILKLAEIPNIVGVKDASGSFTESQKLIMNKPKDFAVLTGEDALFYSTLALGGDGGILASCHVNTKDFVQIYKNIKEGKMEEALKLWKPLYKFIPLLFKEPNPAPIKYIAKKMNLIDSDEIRLPLVKISGELEKELDEVLKL